MNAAGPRARWIGLGFLALALAGMFQAGLLFGGPLHHFDWLVHWHYYDWIRQGLQEHGTLPRFMVDAWHTTNFVANAQSPVLGPLVWLLAFLPTGVYVKLLIWLYTAIGALGGYALARDLGARPAVAACAAVLFTCSGFFAAHVAVGHHWSLGAYWLPLLLLCVRRGAAGSRGAWLGAAAIQAVTLLEGQHHPFLWQNGLLLGWAGLEWLRTRDPAALRAWAGSLLVGMALAGVRVVPLLLEFAGYAPDDRIGGLPPGALGFALASRSQGPGTAGLGVVFAHGSGWWEYTFYLGIAGLTFVAVGLAGALRSQASLLGVGLVAGLLCLDTTGLGFDLWEGLRELPVASSQRCPARLLVLFQFTAIFAAAAGWERWLAAAAAGWERWLAGGAAGWERWLAGGAARRWGGRGVDVVFGLLAALLAADLVSAARPWQAAAIGPAQTARPHRMDDPVLAPEGSGTVTALERSPNRLRFRVESDRAAFLVFPLRWPSERDAWLAEPFPTAATPTQLLAVRVPAGVNEVDLRYRTPGLRAGMALSVIAALGVVGATLLRSRRPWGPEPPS